MLELKNVSFTVDTENGEKQILKNIIKKTMRTFIGTYCFAKLICPLFSQQYIVAR